MPSHTSLSHPGRLSSVARTTSAGSSIRYPCAFFVVVISSLFLTSFFLVVFDSFFQGAWRYGKAIETYCEHWNSQNRSLHRQRCSTLCGPARVRFPHHFRCEAYLLACMHVLRALTHSIPLARQGATRKAFSGLCNCRHTAPITHSDTGLCCRAAPSSHGPDQNDEFFPVNNVHPYRIFFHPVAPLFLLPFTCLHLMGLFVYGLFFFFLFFPTPRAPTSHLFCVTIWSYSHVCLGHCCNYYNEAITIIMYMYNGIITGDNYSFFRDNAFRHASTTLWHFCDGMFRNLLLWCSCLVLLNDDAPLQ